ncbi:uncharacterized protein LOC6728254 [Drosophila simulans]|uniref:RING-type E3 ubiquitin transferase n=1 Tax=Drosophila simulans TaxID=7240 RepID=B4R1V4_DROSI|nr:uncharacterized protein LOC6728254 [Drosophila simulans]EDX13106.1 GD18889 [Drosophila simulans]KMZ03851.1 uncharacterized protein Dsimw501_GD18889 [Drosophila simulans]
MEAVARENDQPNHCDINEEEVPANEAAENPNHGLQGEVTSKGYTPDLSNAYVNQQQQQKNNGEDDLLPETRLRRRRRNLLLDTYLCNECHQYVRGGVVTICGHLFCWTCLWPKLSGTTMPRCPFCLRHLLMYEDIMPFHGEGPNAHQEDNNVPAQPGSVPRPTGLYLSDTEFPCWFTVNDPIDGCPATFPEIRRERDLYCAIRLMPMVYPWIGAQITFLKWFQLGCVLVIFLIWSILSLF